MSFTARFDQPNYDDFDVDLSQCENCTFECGATGYCLKKHGENYIICSLFLKKGYTVANKDWGRTDTGETIPGVELYRREARRFMESMARLGHTCTTYHHPLGKRYLTTVIIDGGVEPISLAVDFLKMEALK